MIITIEESRIKYIAQHCANWTYQHLMHITDIDSAIALEASKDAGDAFAQALTRELIEHDVMIEKVA